MNKAEEEFEAWVAITHLERSYIGAAEQAWLASREATAKRAAEICRDHGSDFCAERIEQEFS